MKIGEFSFKTPVFLAPMAGVTDTAYRIIAHDMGCPLCFAEMVSSQGIHFRNERTLAMLQSEQEERPLAMQIFANTPEMAAEAAAFVEALGTADILDFNMGCPAPKIVKNGEGSALMRDPERAFAILSAIRKAVKMPVTVKMRKGWDEASVNVVEMAKLAEEAGVDAIAVHGRTREQFYTGHADWEIIGEVKRAVKIPVIANGDIFSGADAAHILRYTGADLAMVGRGSFGDPWLFARGNAAIAGEPEPPLPPLRERIEAALHQIEFAAEIKGERLACLEARSQFCWYLRGVPHANVYKQEVVHVETLDDLRRNTRAIQRDLRD